MEKLGVVFLGLVCCRSPPIFGLRIAQCLQLITNGLESNVSHEVEIILSRVLPPHFHMVMSNRFSAFTWALTPFLNRFKIPEPVSVNLLRAGLIR